MPGSGNYLKVCKAKAYGIAVGYASVRIARRAGNSESMSHTQNIIVQHFFICGAYYYLRTRCRLQRMNRSAMIKMPVSEQYFIKLQSVFLKPKQQALFVSAGSTIAAECASCRMYVFTFNGPVWVVYISKAFTPVLNPAESLPVRHLLFQTAYRRRSILLIRQSRNPAAF